MTRHEFATKAIKGGFNPLGQKYLDARAEENGTVCIKYALWDPPVSITFEKLVYETKAWEAVGKGMEWQNMPRIMVLEIQDRVIQRAKDEDFRRILTRESKHRPWWLHMMHKMFDAQVEGKTIDDYIATL